MTASVALLAFLVAAGEPANPLTNGSFESLVGGAPVDWQILGDGTVGTAEHHSGQRALHLVRTPETVGEVGLNRRWEPKSGRQDAMLRPPRGGIRFWYKAIAAEPAEALTVVVVPMSDAPLEVGGHRLAWRVPRDHVGDGQWHQGAFAYDFTAVPKVVQVHVGARLLGRRGDLWLDDFEWLPTVGPVLQTKELTFRERAGHAGREGLLTLTLANLGDQRLPAGQATLALPAGLATPQAVATVSAVAPQATAVLRWTVTGRRDRPPYDLSVAVAAGDQRSTARLNLAGQLRLLGLRSDRVVLTPGQAATVQLLARNEGAAEAPAPAARLSGPPELTIAATPAPGAVPPGSEAPVAAWRVTATRPTPLAALVATAGDGPESWRCELAVPARLPAGPAGLGAQVEGDQATVGSDTVRLRLSGLTAGYPVGLLQVPAANSWRTVALLPWLGRVATSGGEAVLRATRAEATGGQLRLTGETALAGATWRATWILTASEQGLIGYSLAAQADGDVALRALDGPLLYAGQDDATPREDGVLPGLEWLVRGEESSNGLDIKPDHPDHDRYVPHPLKVCVPAVGLRFGDVAVGLLWDAPADQPSQELAGPASVIFASPDRFGGHASHLVGLALPAVGRGLAENQRRAAQPLAVKARQALRLRADLAALTGVRDSLAVLDRWYAKHGFPEPLPLPRGDAKRELEFSLRGYFPGLALWNPEWKKWYSDLVVSFSPWDGGAHDLLLGAEILGAGPVVDQARQLAAEVWPGSADERSRRWQRHADPGGLQAAERAVRGLLAGQQPDGTWRFGGEHAGTAEATESYEALGETGASEVGLTAPHATQVLDYALLTGDPAARVAGLKALAALRRFTVPRAAQVWEVPVHTPDIYASAVAVQAFLAGYRLTGDAGYLRDAAYWARTGLPFVYVWHPADQLAVQGASIPVFGATHYGLSWFGVAVQWNGLAYANALFDLAPFDDTFPWRRVAENLLRSAMYQQATTGDRLSMWPDALNFIAGRPGAFGSTPPCFTPHSVIDLNLRFQGLHTHPELLAVRDGREQCALRGPCAFSDAQWAGGRLQFTAGFTPPERGAVEVMGVSLPNAVRIDGRAVPAVADPWAQDEPGWRYFERTRLVEVRVTAPGPHRIELDGVRRAAPPAAPPVLTAIDFRFDHDDQGWAPDHDLAAFRVERGALRTQATGGDPYLSRGSLSVAGQAGDVLVLRLATSGGQAGGSVFWTTSTAAGMSPERELPLAVPTNGQVAEVRVPVGQHAKWAGQTITGLRLDPGSGPAGVAIVIESVRLEAGR